MGNGRTYGRRKALGGKNMTMRVTGLASGLDTESIIAELVSVNSYKVASLQKEQTKLSWKTDAWKSMNSKVYSFYTSTLSDLRFSSSYSTRKTTVSDSSVATVTTSSKAANTVQSMRVDKMAKAGYLTGGELDGSVTAETKLSDIDSSLAGQNGKIGLKIGSGETVEIEITEETTVQNIVDQLKEQGLNANFDEKNQRMFISAADTGEEYDFTLEGLDEAGTKALQALKIDVNAADSDATKIDGQNAVIYLNNARFESESNTFEINGLTINVLQETGDKEVTLTTGVDTEGMYSTIKNFLTKYNELMEEMLTAYNADSSSGYEPLTSDEKSAMTESEIDEWEKKIKDSLLRRDETLGTTISYMNQIMNQGFELSDGTTMYLFDFGINTPGYFNAEQNQRNSFHIDGDKDDTVSSKNEDKLMAAINQDPDKVASFFQKLAGALYTKLTDLMGTSDYSSAYTLYNDKKMKTEYTDYTSKIAQAEEDLNDKMDRYYEKFAAMESAMAQLQNQQNSLTSMLG